MSNSPHLLTPGPVPIPDFIQQAIAKPVIHHRTEAYRKFYEELLAGLRYLFQTEGRTGTYIGSGTYGVEMAIRSLFKTGETVAVVDMGKFSNRWVAYANLMGINTLPITSSWGHSLSLSELEKKSRELIRMDGIILTHSETSTGALIDLEEMAFFLRRKYPDLLILVDAITSAGTLPYYHDAWDIDLSIVASQKALMNPAGTVAYAMSERAFSQLRPTDYGDFSNLHNYAVAAEQNSYPYTPPVQLQYGLKAALDYIQAETLPTVWTCTRTSARTFRAGLAELGGTIFPTQPSDSLTAFSFPDTDMSQLKAELFTKGFELSGGQGELKGKILRVSHMGTSDEALMKKLLEALASIQPS